MSYLCSFLHVYSKIKAPKGGSTVELLCFSTLGSQKTYKGSRSSL